MQVGCQGDSIRKNVNGLSPVQIEERFRGGKLEYFTALPEAVETTPAQFGQARFGQIARFMFDRKEHVITGTFRVEKHCVRNLIHRIFGDAATTYRAERAARARPQQPHEIVDFCGGGNG